METQKKTSSNIEVKTEDPASVWENIQMSTAADVKTEDTGSAVWFGDSVYTEDNAMPAQTWAVLDNTLIPIESTMLPINVVPKVEKDMSIVSSPATGMQDDKDIEPIVSSHQTHSKAEVQAVHSRMPLEHKTEQVQTCKALLKNQPGFRPAECANPSGPHVQGCKTCGIIFPSTSTVAQILEHSKMHKLFPPKNENAMNTVPSNVTEIQYDQDMKPIISKQDTFQPLKSLVNNDGDSSFAEDSKGNCSNLVTFISGHSNMHLFYPPPKETKKDPNLILKCSNCQVVFKTENVLKVHQRWCLSEKKEMRKESFTCCGLVFSDASGWLEHQQKHVTQQMERGVCGEKYTKTDSYSTDVKKHKEDKTITCNSCRRRFKYEQAFLLHKKTCGICDCWWCKESFNKLTDFVQHANSHHPHSKFYQCGICKAVFQSESEFFSHFNSAHSVQKIVEQKCVLVERDACKDKEMMSPDPKCKDLLLEHFSGVPSERYICIYCRKEFDSTQDLSKHTDLHLGVKNKLKCDTCQQPFSTVDTLIYHQKYCCNGVYHIKPQPMDTNPESYLCEYCSKIIYDKRNYENHKMTHTGEGNYRCEECGKTFIQKNHFLTHQRKHKGERPFKCPLCPKASFSKTSLEIHKKTHFARERKHKCSMCHKGFLSNAHLQRHLQNVHSEEKTYSCIHCDATFNNRSDFVVHNKTHRDGETQISYRCQECSKEFRSYTSLWTHRKIHKPRERSFVCTICQFGFYSKSNLERHLKLHQKKLMSSDNSALGQANASQVNDHQELHTDSASSDDMK